MIFQFTTGSVEDRQQYGVHLSVLNAGIQPANVACIFKKYRGSWLTGIFERQIKVPPREEAEILNEAGLKDVHCEILLKVDSPSLIVTVVGEARYPLHCQTLFVDDITADVENGDSPSRSMSLLWGYTVKGEPF